MPFSPYSNTTSGTTQTPVVPPLAPSNLVATAFSQSQIDLTWQDNSGDENAFHIERSPNGTSGWVEIATTAVDDTTYSDTGLAASVVFYYRVRARKNPFIFSGYSNTANATTQAVEILWWFESDAIPVQSDNTDLSGWPSQFAVDVDMQFPGTNGGTKPKYRTNIFGSLPAVRVAAGNQGDIPYPNISPVLTGKSCTFYHVLDYSAQQSGAAGLLQNFLTGQAAAITLAVSADLIDAGNNQNNQVSFEVNRTSVPNTVDKDFVNGTSGRQLLVFTFNVSTGFATLHWNGQLVSTIAMPSIPAGGFAFGQDFIEFFALNGGTNACVGDHGAAIGFVGAHSDVTRAGYESTLITKYGITDTTFVNAPSNLVATAISGTQIDLTWTDNSDNEDGFSLERSPNGTSGWTEIATPAANATSYSNTGLTAATTYYYRLRAQTGPIPTYSAYSGTANATTQAGTIDWHTLSNQMFIFESDGITVQGDNTDLTTWPDDSTSPNNGNDMVFPSAGDPGGIKPKYRTNHFGSLPAVQIIDTAEGEIANYSPTSSGISVTAYFVLDYQQAAQASGIGLMFYPYDVVFLLGGNYIAPYVCSDLVTTNKVGFEEDFANYDLAAAANGKQLLTFKFNKATGVCTLYRNGTQVGTVSGLGTEGWRFEDLITWFSLIGGTVGQFIGYVGAVGAFSTVHDDATRSGIEGYLISKYGL